MGCRLWNSLVYVKNELRQMSASAMIVNLRAIAKAAEQGMPSMVERGPECLRMAADEIQRLLSENRCLQSRIECQRNELRRLQGSR
jgi:hypothetical protein